MSVQHEDQQIVTPCQADPDAWFPNDSTNDLGKQVAERAAKLCLSRCPILAECAARAEQKPPSHGVWAGKDWGAC